MKLAVIGIDVGGTGLRGARVEGASWDEIHSLPLDSRSVDSVHRGIRRLVDELGPYDALGVAVPGFADGRVIHSSPNFPDWSNNPFAQQLSESFGCPVQVENDASAAAWGAFRLRGSKEDLVLLTLGTGVGGGLVANGELVRGRSGSAGEVGHVYAGGTRKCGCGATGCLETWISTGGLVLGAREQGREVTSGRDVVEAATQGEEWARHVCTEAGMALGLALRNVVNLMNPDTVVLAGGLASGKSVFEQSMWSVLRNGAVPPALERLEILWEGRSEGFAIRGVTDLAESTWQ